jgi:hypothetical protein
MTIALDTRVPVPIHLVAEIQNISDPALLRVVPPRRKLH